MPLLAHRLEGDRRLVLTGAPLGARHASGAHDGLGHSFGYVAVEHARDGAVGVQCAGRSRYGRRFRIRAIAALAAGSYSECPLPMNASAALPTALMGERGAFGPPVVGRRSGVLGD